MRDLIDRQAAIDVVLGVVPYDEYWKEQIEKAVNALPSAQPYSEADIQKMQDLEQAEMLKAYECGRASAQPEIIRCKECKHYEGGWYCSAWNNSPGFPIVTEKGYCNLAERRTDESD